MKRLLGNVASVLTSLLVILSLANAAQLKDARVTQVVSDVKLLPQQAAPRPAALNDPVRTGTAVRTGTQSRSELTFSDLTITRLGANTIFSFEEGTRMMDLRDGAILFQVPKGSGGATIRTTAVTAAITGTTGIGEFHPATASRPQPFSKWLCLEGTFHLTLPNGQSVELGPGKMVTTNGQSFSPVMTFDISQVMKTSLLVNGYDTPLASLSLIQIEESNQLGLIARTPITNRSTLFDPTDIIDAVDQGITAQESPTVPPTPPITPTPSTPTPTPNKFGALAVIASSGPYIITSDTEIATDPSITTSGQTDFGKIYRGPAQDGPLSAFIFGSTSAFDTESGFDAELSSGMSAAVFKFTSLQLTGDPTISTSGGPVNLGLIAVNDITSGGPGGVLTFTGIERLLVATQNGSITLGPEISFSGLSSITFYARGSSSVLTLASDVTTTNRIRLYGEDGIQLSSDLRTQDLIAFTGGDFDFTAGSIDADMISIIAGGDVNFDLGAPLTFTTTDFHLEADGDIEITDRLTVSQNSSGQIKGLNISLLAGGAIHIGGDLQLTTASDIETGGNIVVTSGGNTTIDSAFSLRTFSLSGTATATGSNIIVNIGGDLTVGDLTFTVERNVKNVSVADGANITIDIAGNLITTGDGAVVMNVDNSNGGHIGTGGNISFSAGGDVTADSIDALVNNRNGGSIDSGSNLTFNIGGALTTTGDVSFITTNRNDGAGGGTIGSNVVLTLSASSVSVGTLTTSISTNGGGEIAGSASSNAAVDGALVAAGFVGISIQNTGFNIFGGPFIATANIGGNATINLGAGSIATGDVLDVEIDNNGAGHIGGNAIIDVVVSNNVTVSSDIAVEGVGDAFFEIVNTGEMRGATVIDGGTIDGNAGVSFSAANVTTQGRLEVGILNNDQRFLNGGGDIGGDADLFFSAANVSATNFFNLVINNAQGSIGGGSNINAQASSISTGNTFFAHILNENGQIGLGAAVSVLTPGNISATQDATFEIANPDGRIGDDATIDVSAANITTGRDLFALINNTGDGDIGGEATIDMNISGNATVTRNATIQIFGNDSVGAVAINFNGGNYAVDGQFFSAIDGKGTIAFNNASVHADVLKAGVFGTNGVLNIGGGTLSADTTLRLYAPGSNGQLNFISNVTLGGDSAKILAANSITISNGVVVTVGDIGDENPADVFTNNPNYSSDFGGNDSTTGTFAGSGANDPQPLSSAPPFNDPPGPATAHRGRQQNGIPPRPAPSIVAKSPHRSGGDTRIANRRPSAPVIKVKDSGQLLSLLDHGAANAGGKVTVSPTNNASDPRNSSRVDGQSLPNENRRFVSDPSAASHLP